MKRIISFVLVAVMLFGFAACASSKSITPAIYSMKDEHFPQIHLRENNNFTFTLDMARSQRYNGTYTISDKTLTLECDDGNVFCFDIKTDAFEFNAELSDEIICNISNVPEITDGTRFEKTHEHE